MFFLGAFRQGSPVAAQSGTLLQDRKLHDVPAPQQGEQAKEREPPAGQDWYSQAVLSDASGGKWKSLITSFTTSPKSAATEL